MTPFILFLSFAVSFALRVDLVNSPSTPMDAIRLQARADYIECLTQEIVYGYDEIRTVHAGVEQEVPPATLSALYAELRAVRKDGTLVDPPNFSMVQTRGEDDIVLQTSYDITQLTDVYGCREIPETPAYTGRMCEFTMDYTATELGVVLATVDFTLTVKQFKMGVGTYVVSAVKIYKKLCDCEIIEKYTLHIEAYKDAECTIPLNGESLVYGAPLCLKVTSPDSLASRYKFTPTSVLMRYPDAEGETISVEMIPVATVASGDGWAEIVLDATTVGEHISFLVTVVLGEGTLIEDVAQVDYSTEQPKNEDEANGNEGENENPKDEDIVSF